MSETFDELRFDGNAGSESDVGRGFRAFCRASGIVHRELALEKWRVEVDEEMKNPGLRDNRRHHST